jgi:hypothetical protein
MQRRIEVGVLCPNRNDWLVVQNSKRRKSGYAASILSGLRVGFRSRCGGFHKAELPNEVRFPGPSEITISPLFGPR